MSFTQPTRRPSRRVILLVLAGGSAAAVTLPTLALRGGDEGQTQLPTTVADFFAPGTQPQPDPFKFEPVQVSMNCTFCHSDYSAETAPYDTWIASMKGQAARDPIWYAALNIANQDADFAGEFCIRCHSPGAWLGGRSESGTIDDFIPDDFDGINCHFCHRAVNPELGDNSAIGYPPSPSNPDPDPTPDVDIIGALAKEGLLPIGNGNGQYVVDPSDVRRGPYDDVPSNLHGLDMMGQPVDLIFSPFHQEGALCGTCHDVSNPVYMREPDGTFVLTPLGQPHPTGNPMDMFPEQRTYSEWAASDFPTKGVFYEDGRFGGNHPTGIMNSCQDCHMPNFEGGGCVFFENPPFFARPDIGQHSFSGSNTWVIAAIRDALGEEADLIGLTEERVQDAKARVVDMLRAASDLDLTQEGSQLKIRVTNQSGHKIPSGYPEGRRMWVNVQFLDKGGALVQEIGGYDFESATLDETDTKIYQTEHGIDETVSETTGIPAGKSFHLALNNVILNDNRIPPIGFTNAGFEAVQAEPVDYTYADGQHWDDTFYDIPNGVASAVVTVYYQTTSREYIEFLRDHTDDETGQEAYDLWVAHGKSAPVDMDTAMIELTPALLGDLNGDGLVNGADVGLLLAAWGSKGGPADLNNDGIVNGADLGLQLGNWTG